MFAPVITRMLPAPLASMALPEVVMMISVPPKVVDGVPVLPLMVSALFVVVVSVCAPVKLKTGEPAAVLAMLMPVPLSVMVAPRAIVPPVRAAMLTERWPALAVMLLVLSSVIPAAPPETSRPIPLPVMVPLVTVTAAVMPVRWRPDDALF